jgi:hypothetical protein
MTFKEFKSTGKLSRPTVKAKSTTSSGSTAKTTKTVPTTERKGDEVVRHKREISKSETKVKETTEVKEKTKKKKAYDKTVNRKGMKYLASKTGGDASSRDWSK